LSGFGTAVAFIIILHICRKQFEIANCRKMMSRILIAAWILYLSAVVLVFLLPRQTIGIFNAIGFRYYLPFLIVVSGAYGVFRLYRAGMSKESRRGPSETHPPHRP
jgi:hypothetical protein